MQRVTHFKLSAVLKSAARHECHETAAERGVGEGFKVLVEGGGGKLANPIKQFDLCSRSSQATRTAKGGTEATSGAIKTDELDETFDTIEKEFL